MTLNKDWKPGTQEERTRSVLREILAELQWTRTETNKVLGEILREIQLIRKDLKVRDQRWIEPPWAREFIEKLEKTDGQSFSDLMDEVRTESKDRREESKQ